MRFRVLLLTGAVVFFAPAGVVGQEHSDLRWESIVQAWDDGDFMEALRGMQQLLNGPDGERFLERIALITGELYRTTLVHPDGRDPRWSHDGRLLAFEVPDENGASTHVVRLDGLEEVAQVRGRSALFNPVAPEIAFIELETGPDFERAMAEARNSLQVRDRESFRRLQAELARVEAEHSVLRVRNVDTGEENELRAPTLGVSELTYAPDGTLYFSALEVQHPGTANIWTLREGRPAQITSGTGMKRQPMILDDGKVLAYLDDVDGLVLLDLGSGVAREFPGVQSPVASGDGKTIAFIANGDGITQVYVLSIERVTTPAPIVSGTARMSSPAVSHDGSYVAFQMMVRENWEVFVAPVDGGELIQLTSDDQHDLFPVFLPPPSASTRPQHSVLVIKGEGRHRRSYLYDLETRREIRLFHNNTVRTVSPEYAWAVSPDGSKVAVVSERDGDTISPERSLHVIDLEQVLPQAEIAARVASQLKAEQTLREEGERAFQSLADDVAAVVADVSRTRIYAYEKDLFAFGSKYITQPGNALAIEYIADKLRSFGYEPELQWFEPRPGIRSANVIATLPGTRDPQLVYVISSHFDSVERGPGADDNTSGTTALLEAARVMKNHPMPRTIQFAFFTGEEAGLLGSRHFVREAVANDVQIVGALNNDMVGYANDARLDNTIRYSNAGIRDIQHAAAFLFTDLITYDAKYYKNTDAHAYYDAYGDIVGGIGSYPILANPHYHQTHDVLETINHQLVAEVSKTSVATLMYLASSAARLKGVTAERDGSSVTVRWDPAPESDVVSYTVVYWGPDGSSEVVEVVQPPALEYTFWDISPGGSVGVRPAARARGNNPPINSWDWARVEVP